MAFAPATPVVMTVDVQVDASSLLIALQPLAASDRVSPVGPAILRGPYDAASTVWDLGALSLPPEANPVSSSAVEAEGLVLQYVQPLSCGNVDGDLIAPVPLSLFGSTFTLLPIATIADAPEPPPIDCQGALADPL